MSSIFSKIIKGEIPSFKILENENFYAFLDIMPLRHGHTLVVPKLEVDKIYDLENDVLSEILIFSKPIIAAIEEAFPCQRVGLSVIGLEVPHAHLHLVPIDSANDLNFTRPKLKLSNEELAETQKAILRFL